jgi:hypothetical protein
MMSFNGGFKWEARLLLPGNKGGKSWDVLANDLIHRKLLSTLGLLGLLLAPLGLLEPHLEPMGLLKPLLVPLELTRIDFESFVFS